MVDLFSCSGTQDGTGVACPNRDRCWRYTKPTEGEKLPFADVLEDCPDFVADPDQQ